MVQLAYRNLCDACAKKKKLCPGCSKPPELAELAEGEGAPEEDEAGKTGRRGRGMGNRKYRVKGATT